MPLFTTRVKASTATRFATSSRDPSAVRPSENAITEGEPPDLAPRPTSSPTPASLPRASTVMRAPAHFFSYSFATSRATGAKAVDPVILREPRAQSIGGGLGGLSSRAMTMPASVTTLRVSVMLISRAARLNSGGLSSGVALRLGCTSPSRMPPVSRIARPTSPPDSSTSSLKWSPWLSGTRGMRSRLPS